MPLRVYVNVSPSTSIAVIGLPRGAPTKFLSITTRVVSQPSLNIGGELIFFMSSNGITSDAVRTQPEYPIGHSGNVPISTVTAALVFGKRDTVKIRLSTLPFGMITCVAPSLILPLLTFIGMTISNNAPV